MNTYMESRYRWYGCGYEYESATRIAGWPLLHICAGVDPLTLRPRVARGIIAIGDLAIGVLAIGGFACGLVTIGGTSLGLLLAIGGAAVGLGLSIGGFAVGSIAIGGVALGLVHALGGAAFGPGIVERLPYAGWSATWPSKR
jgi:hypothetical protein